MNVRGQHLTFEQHMEIRDRLARNEMPADIAAAVGCKVESINKIRKKAGLMPIPSSAKTKAPKAPKVRIPPLPNRMQVETVLPTPAAHEIRRFLLTAAQDDTPIHLPFWRNLMAYAEAIGAEIMVGGFTYQKGLFEDHSVAAGRFASELVPHLRAEAIRLAPRLVWRGNANILPTATDPLAGWDTQTRDAWGIFPHAKIALKCVPVMPGKPGKQIMTTGVATVENYVQRNAGQKAEFHHTIGATIVEVMGDRFWCRQISACRDGAFQDLDIMVRDGVVTRGNSVEGITYGDIHREYLDPDKAQGSWGIGGSPAGGAIVDVLRPGYQFFEDVFDFTARSHHSRGDPHLRARLLALGMDNVEDGILLAAKFLEETRRPSSTSVAVFSNHDGLHILNWLRDSTAAADPVNAYYWHRLNAAYHMAIRQGDAEFMPHEHALREASADRLENVRFLREGESFVICQGVAPIECGLHAHLGPNGAKGNAASLAKIVERANVAHSHSPCIRDALYQAGTSSSLMPYAARGPGAWHHADIVTYKSGKRTIVTYCGSEWRAA